MFSRKKHAGTYSSVNDATCQMMLFLSGIQSQENLFFQQLAEMCSFLISTSKCCSQLINYQQLYSYILYILAYSRLHSIQQQNIFFYFNLILLPLLLLLLQFFFFSPSSFGLLHLLFLLLNILRQQIALDAFFPYATVPHSDRYIWH